MLTLLDAGKAEIYGLPQENIDERVLLSALVTNNGLNESEAQNRIDCAIAAGAFARAPVREASVDEQKPQARVTKRGDKLGVRDGN